MITAQIIRDWSSIKETLFQGGLNFGGTGSSANVFSDIAGGDVPPPFGATPQGDAKQQLQQGETYWLHHGQKNNCPPGFPPGYTCLGM